VRAINREELQSLVDAGAQLVEVLPAKEYEAEHLPGAISLPLTKLTEKTAGDLEKARPVVVYCFDGL